MKKLQFITFALIGILSITSAEKKVAEGTATLSITAFKVLDEKGNQVLRINESGVLYMNGSAIGKIDPQGRILDEEGKEISHLQEDGTLCWEDGQPIGKVHPDGIIEIPNSLTLSWDSKGQMNIEDDELLSLIPADSPSRRAASVAFLTCFTARETKEVNKSEQWKIWVAAEMKGRTSAPNAWIARRLHMGVPHAVTVQVRAFKSAHNNAL